MAYGDDSKIRTSVEECQLLLTFLFNFHYGLTLNDTPFHDSQMIEDIMEADDVLLDAVNQWVLQCDLVSIDHYNSHWFTHNPILVKEDIIFARRKLSVGPHKKN